MYKRKNKS